MTATVYTYFHQCHRKMWLHHHQLVMEHTSDLVAQGRVLHETSYQQRSSRYRELQLPGLQLHPIHEAQLVNYLQGTGLDTGLLIHFGLKVVHKRKYRMYQSPDASFSSCLKKQP